MAAKAGALEARASKDHAVSDGIIDSNGRPMFKVTAQASELIGLPQYSNITVGPIVLTDWFSYTTDDPDERAEERKQALERLQRDVEDTLMIRRQKIMEQLRVQPDIR